ncbi:uncharacterized protein LOC117898625 [Drosophila subobscura]|uniref:uncharacterized protein LOC117898625 n=1 Tax=Drosophila subobscura TaxID=7241 RepID=UPI00155B360F|nr:uncharacterized protein LOC117898625 [Drosophila subobscura]
MFMYFLNYKCINFFQRDEYLRSPSTKIGVQQQNFPTSYRSYHTNMKDAQAEKNVNNTLVKHNQNVTFVRSSGITNGAVFHEDVIENEWNFPPKVPAPHIYHCINPDLLVGSDKNGFKGLRKQFSGRFKRLVTRKVEHGPVIPPELKPQLKTIYVY